MAELDDDQYWTVYHNLTPTPQGRLFARRLPQSRQPMTAGPMMVRVNDPKGFIQKISKWFEKQNNGLERTFSLEIPETRQTLGFDFNPGRLTLTDRQSSPHRQLSRSELTSMIFGRYADTTSPAPLPAATLFPFYFPIWMLDHS